MSWKEIDPENVRNQDFYKGGRQMAYKVHRFDLRMTADQTRLERFLNDLKGEVVAVVPNVSISFFWIHRVDFLLIVEKVT